MEEEEEDVLSSPCASRDVAIPSSVTPPAFSSPRARQRVLRERKLHVSALPEIVPAVLPKYFGTLRDEEDGLDNCRTIVFSPNSFTILGGLS